MIRRMQAVYRGGVFLPAVRCDLPENSAVELVVQEAARQPPQVTAVEERRRILKRVTERMRANPLPADAPRFSRDQLHERC